MLEMSNRMARIQRVPFLLLKEECNKEDYIPKVVSIGPYHHGKKELSLVEAFKLKALDLFVLGGNKESKFYYDKVFEVIGDVRKYYNEESTKDFNDDDLARMMILDACFIIIQMGLTTLQEDEVDPSKVQSVVSMYQHLGLLIMKIVHRDLFLLENQIPFRIIKLLIELRYEKDEGQDLINRFLNHTAFGDHRRKRGGASTSIGNEVEPLHLLDAFRLLIIYNGADTGPSTILETITNPAKADSSWCSGVLSSIHKIKAYKRLTVNEDGDKKERFYFRSATDLKAKGIHFSPSPTESLMDVKFTSKFLYSQLQLPIWFVSTLDKVIFLNIIAYEYSPNTFSMGEVTSYINFMKSLIEGPEDVKELREKKILITTLGSDEKVFNMYKEINTYDGCNSEIFRDVKGKIQSHYNSKRKMWIAELINTYFRSPWTVITFLAAFTLLCLSSIQTYYTMHPKSDK